MKILFSKIAPGRCSARGKENMERLTDKLGHKECVHTKAQCHHEECKCSECPLTNLICEEFYKAIDRCYEDAYASGCLAGIELGKYEAKAKLKELRGDQL